MDDPAAGKAAGFFGRRKGKRLRDEQASRIETLLPKLRIDLTSPQIALTTAEHWLEIGFGGGEHLADIAEKNPDIRFFGCEPFVNGVAKLVGEIAHRDLTNIRIHDGNASDVLAKLPAASLSRIYLLYPDPWPKRRQRKRLFSTFGGRGGGHGHRVARQCTFVGAALVGATSVAKQTMFRIAIVIAAARRSASRLKSLLQKQLTALRFRFILSR